MASPNFSPAIDETKLNAFMGQAVQDMGAAIHASLIVIGDKLGLYKAMDAAGPLTPAELSAKAHTDERYTREWLNANAASGYIAYDAATKTYTLLPEQAFALAQDDSPAFLPGAFQVIGALWRDEPKITEAFRTGRGVGWHEHDPEMFEGTERFFRPQLMPPTSSLNGSHRLTGVVAKLEAGGRVADVGCGHGSSTILMAKQPSLTQPSSALITTQLQSIGRSGPPKEQESQTASPSKSPLPRNSLARDTTLSPSSTACTTWATP